MRRRAAFYLRCGGRKKRKAWEGDYICHDGLTFREGQLYHVICYRMKEENVVYLMNDDTGEIQEK
nr:hypothetical protein [uncultured Acetatifactor sp.]